MNLDLVTSIGDFVHRVLTVTDEGVIVGNPFTGKVHTPVIGFELGGGEQEVQ